MLTREKAAAAIEEYLTAAKGLLKAAEELAIEHKLNFTFVHDWKLKGDFDGTCDGSIWGLDPEDFEDYYGDEFNTPGWRSSSDIC